MKQCLKKLVLLIRRLWDVFTVKRRTFAPLFNLHGHVRVQILTHDSMSRYSFEHNFRLLTTETCLYKLYQLWDVTTCNFSQKKTLHFAIMTYEDIPMCKFSHRRTCMYATYHIISYVLSRLPRFHTNVSSARRVHMCANAHIWTRLVDDTFVWNVVIGIKHRKLCDKLHTYTSSYVKICTRRRPCKPKWRRETSFFFF